MSLRAFTCGWFYLPTAFFLGGADDTVLRSPVCSFLIEHPGGLVIFDTGLSLGTQALYDEARAPQEQGFEFPKGTDIAAQLATVGIAADQVRWVVNSHLHVDHCGGNAALPNATVMVQRRELEAATLAAREPPGSRARQLYDLTLWETGQEVVTVEGEHDLFGDGLVTLVPTYGHTPGHQSLRVALDNGNALLAGDCCNLRRSLDDLQVSPADIDPEASLETLGMLSAARAEGTHIFYGHDGDFWDEVPQGTPISWSGSR